MGCSAQKTNSNRDTLFTSSKTEDPVIQGTQPMGDRNEEIDRRRITKIVKQFSVKHFRMASFLHESWRYSVIHRVETTQVEIFAQRIIRQSDRSLG